MNPEVEEWRIIPEFPSYSASNFGRIRREKPANGATVGLVLRPVPMRNGYLQVKLFVDKKPKMRGINRLVLLAFVGQPPSPVHEAAHENGVKSHNYLSNLSWKTPQENAQDKRRHGTSGVGEKNAGAKLTEEFVVKIRREHSDGESQHGLARKYGFAVQTINYVVNRKLWKHVA